MARSESLWQNRNFRRLLAGRIVTNAGDSLYGVAATWLVFELTGSTLYTGIAGFLVFVPRSLRFLTGPFVDQWSLRRLLVGTQIIQAVVVLLIPLASYLNQLTAVMVLAVIPVLSMINQVVYPAQYTALPRIMNDDQLTKANSAFTFAEEGTNMAFEALGGVLIGIIGAVSLYVVNSVTFGTAILLFAGVRIPPAEDASKEEIPADASTYVSDLIEGVRIVRGSVWTKLILSAVVANFMVGITFATLPAFAASRGGSGVYGFLLASIGGGLALGAVVASQLNRIKAGQIYIIGYGMGFVLWLGAVLSPSVVLTVLLFLLAWIPVGVTNVLENTMLQTLVPDRMVGRVMSVSSSVAWIALPIGSLFGGPLSSLLGSHTVMVLTAFGFGSVSVYFLIEPELRCLPAINELDTTDYDFRIG